MRRVDLLRVPRVPLRGPYAASRRVMVSPRLSVIIPNWNGEALLGPCLAALRSQRLRDFSVLVVDNCSSDGSVRLVQAEFPEFQVLQLASNRLFAGAVNAGIRATDTPTVVLLNNDTEADGGWLLALSDALEERPDVGMAASKLLLFDRRNVLHSAGDSYGVDGVPRNRGVWEEDLGQYDDGREVFSPCGGAAAYRRSMLDTIGLFDEDLGAYCEDVDLAFRAQLAGFKCIFVPAARVYHRLSATGGGPFASYHCGRNFITVAAKNLPGSLLRRHWRRILLRQAGFAWDSLRHVREPAARARLRGQFDGVVGLRSAIAKRSQVAALQRVPDAYLESLLES